MSKHFDSDIKPDKIKQGSHTVAVSKSLSTGIVPLTKAEALYKQEVDDHIEQTKSGVPDFDTGYMYVEHSSTYTINHKLGQVPTRCACYFCEAQEPEDGNDVVYMTFPVVADYGGNVTGFWLKSDDYKNKLTVDASNSTWVFPGKTTGYIRVQLWR